MAWDRPGEHAMAEMIRRAGRGEMTIQMTEETLLDLDVVGLAGAAKNIRGIKIGQPEKPGETLLVGSLRDHLPGSIQVGCGDCATPVWIMPHNYRRGYADVLCPPCALKRHDQERARG